jgi:hypothetical protein
LRFVSRLLLLAVLVPLLPPAAQATALPWPVDVLARCAGTEWVEGSPLPIELETAMSDAYGGGPDGHRDYWFARPLAAYVLANLHKAPCHPMAGHWAHVASVTIGRVELRESGVEAALPWLAVSAEAWVARPAESIDFSLADALLRRAVRGPVRDFLVRVQPAADDPARVAAWIREIDARRLPRLRDDREGRSAALGWVTLFAVLGWPAAMAGWTVGTAREPIRRRRWLLAVGVAFAYHASIGAAAVASMIYGRLVPSRDFYSEGHSLVIAIVALAAAPAALALLLAAWRRRFP